MDQCHSNTVNIYIVSCLFVRLLHGKDGAMAHIFGVLFLHSLMYSFIASLRFFVSRRLPATARTVRPKGSTRMSLPVPDCPIDDRSVTSLGRGQRSSWIPVTGCYRTVHSHAGPDYIFNIAVERAGRASLWDSRQRTLDDRYSHIKSIIPTTSRVGSVVLVGNTGHHRCLWSSSSLCVVVDGCLLHAAATFSPDRLTNKKPSLSGSWIDFV